VAAAAAAATSLSTSRPSPDAEVAPTLDDEGGRRVIEGARTDRHRTVMAAVPSRSHQSHGLCARTRPSEDVERAGQAVAEPGVIRAGASVVVVVSFDRSDRCRRCRGSSLWPWEKIAESGDRRREGHGAPELVDHRLAVERPAEGLAHGDRLSGAVGGEGHLLDVARGADVADHVRVGAEGLLLGAVHESE
jgi:hypothetical protein